VLIRRDGTRVNCGVLARDGGPWFVRQLRRLWRLLRRNLGAVGAAAVIAQLVKAGRLDPLALPLLGIVTNVGVNFMASDFAAGLASPRISSFNQHDSGTGSTTPAVTDTGLVTPTGNARVVGTQSNPAANQYRTVATLAYTSAATITEWGLFSAATGGTLWDRRTFTGVGVANGDSIQFTYTLTISSGGS
jgi:hypothetical protein